MHWLICCVYWFVNIISKKLKETAIGFNMKKSLTQMTKAELIAVVREKESIIGLLNEKIDELEGMAVASSAVPLDADASRMLSLMNQRIKALEEKLGDG